MANLANLQISAGLWEEARALLDNARKADKPHEKCSALYRLKSSEDEEEAKWKSLNKRAVEFKRKVRKYGSVTLSRDVPARISRERGLQKKATKFLSSAMVAKLVASWSEDTLRINQWTCCMQDEHFRLSNKLFARISYQRTCDKPRTLLSMAEDKQIGVCYSYLDGGKKVWLIFKDPKNEFELVLKRDKER